MKKWMPWLVLALAFAAGLVAGGAATTWHYKAKVDRFMKDPGPPTPEKIVERLDHSLRLTEEQKPRILEIIKSHQLDMEEARDDCRAQMDGVLDNVHKEIDVLLNEEQRLEMNKIVERIKQGGRPGPPPGPMEGPGPEGPDGPWPGDQPCDCPGDQPPGAPGAQQP